MTEEQKAAMQHLLVAIEAAKAVGFTDYELELAMTGRKVILGTHHLSQEIVDALAARTESTSEVIEESRERMNEKTKKQPD